MESPYDQKPWLQHYDVGVPANVDIPQHTIHHFLEEAARKFPEETAVIFKGTRISYRQLNTLADAVAAALHADGFRKGDRAMVYMVNTPQFVISYFGVLKAGGVVIATNPLYADRELEHQLSDCGAETIFVMSLFYERLKRVQRAGNIRLRRIIVTNIKEYLPWHLRLLFTLLRENREGHRVTLEPGDEAFQAFVARGLALPAPQVETSPDDVAVLQYTGGTTGVAKGAIGLHRNIVANCYMLRAWDPQLAYQDEIILACLPFFHSYGMIAAMIMTVSLGAAMIIIADPRDQKDILSSINKYHPTFFPGVPAMYVAINNNPDVGRYNIRSIRVCFSASAPLLLDTKLRFEALTNGTLVEAYGLTEAHVATHMNRLYGHNPPGAIGLPLPNVECRIVDVEDGDRVLPLGAMGELVVRAPNVMAGYWGKPEETAVALRDGWLYTGDIARMDEDGFFFIEDRKKDMIIVGGYNVYPREVEEVLARHEAVQEVGVAGVPDPRRGEMVVAWVVRTPGSTITEAELVAWSKTQLARYKYPRFIEFMDELPKSSVGKTLRRELVRLYVDDETEAVDTEAPEATVP